jgi:hypothetical protein
MTTLSERLFAAAERLEAYKYVGDDPLIPTERAVAALLREAAAMCRDAERYRWLRGNRRLNPPWGAGLDTEIDAIMNDAALAAKERP